MDKKNMKEMMSIPNEYEYISKPKLMISSVIKKQLEAKEMSVRGLAEKVGMKHPQVIRVTSVENYNIDTLLKILDGLDLEITIKKKNK